MGGCYGPLCSVVPPRENSLSHHERRLASEDTQYGHGPGALVWGADGEAKPRGNAGSPQTSQRISGEERPLGLPEEGAGLCGRPDEGHIWAGAVGGGGRGSSPLHPGTGLSQCTLWQGTQGTAGQKAAVAHLARRESPAALGGAVLSGAAYNHTPSALHHHISMSPLHLLPKYHTIPVRVNIQHLTQT